MSMAAACHQTRWNASEPGNVAIISRANTPMRAQATASGGYTVLYLVAEYCSAMTLVRAGKRHGIETDTDRLSQRECDFMPDWVFACSYMRLGRDLFPPHHSHHHHHHHWLQYPVLSSLICENSRIEPLREGLTKDGSDDLCCD
jgi:hypothetical protein